jgi:glycosyltransferase involved in cell wall biosynthesis
MSPIDGTIALISPRYAPEIGGVERVVEMTALGLARRGVNVEVITTDPTGRLPRLERRDGVIVRRFRTVANDAIYFVSPGLGLWLLQHARRFALLHVHSYHTPLLIQAAVTSRRAHLPLVVTPHYHGTGHSPVRRALHGPYRPIGAWALRQAARITCVSEIERALLSDHFGSRLPVTVIPNGVEVDELAPARAAAETSPRPEGSLRVLSVGRLAAYKQANLAVQALRHLPPAAEVTVVGQGQIAVELRQLAHTLGVSARVHLPGLVTRDDLIDQYGRADVATSMSRHEAFGLAVLEALVAGLPVVASDIPAHREVAAYAPAGRVRLVSPNAHPTDLAAALQEAAALGRVATIDGWPLPTWEQNADATARSYAEVLAAHESAAALGASA